MPSALTTRLALAALACAICATPAQAQGGFLKKMKQKAAEAAGQKVVEKAADKAGVEAPGQRAGSVTPPAPKFDDRVVEITDARISGMVKALGVERTEAERQTQQSAANQQRYDAEKRAYDAKYAEYRKAADAYERRQAEYQMCRTNAFASSKETQATQQKMAMHMAANGDTAELRREQQHIQELNKRAEAANRRGDKKTVAAIMDTVQIIMTRLTGVSGDEMRRMGHEGQQKLDAANKCVEPGTAPVEPEAPNSGAGGDSQRAVFEAAAKASGLTPEQYAVMRERLAYIVGVNAEFRSQTSYAYSADEIAAVKKRLSELKPYEEQLTMGNAPTWQFENNANAGNEGAAPQRARRRPR